MMMVPLVLNLKMCHLREATMDSLQETTSSTHEWGSQLCTTLQEAAVWSLVTPHGGQGGSCSQT
jgi:hypothetical protein